MRVEKGFTTAAIADKLGISEPTYRRYESDKSCPDLNMLEKLAKVLEKNFLDLLPTECFVHNNYEQKGGVVVNLGTINNLSEKLIEIYEKKLFDNEKRLIEKDELINYLKSQLSQKNFG